MKDTPADFSALLVRLQAQALRLASARAETLRLERRDPAQRWRGAALLWPLFSKG